MDDPFDIGPSQTQRRDQDGDQPMIDIGDIAARGGAHASGAPALIDPYLGTGLSFGQLARRTESLTAALAKVLGLRPRDRVAALSQNSLEFFELYLAGAKAGTMLFPLNWRFSPSQVTESLLDATPRAVFYDREFSPVIDEIKRQVDVEHWIEWYGGEDSSYEDLLRQGGRAVEQGSLIAPSGTDVRELPYLAVSTGGTTGVAKCAVHSQSTYAACAINYLAAARIVATDIYMMLGQLFHVIGYMPLAYLAMGRPVVLTNFEAEEIAAILFSENVSGFMAIATMLPRLVNAVKAIGKEPASVRQVEYGGAPMGAEVIREAGEVFNADLLQAWGMSELGPGTYLSPAAHRRALSGERPELLRSCGQAALLSTVAVLGEDGALAAQDRSTMGEICHRGPNNMISYWNKPAETADILRDGWIHSGDAGVWDDEGFIFIVDRIKSMMISGGENIFPGEIERVLGNHPDIAEVVVVGVPDAIWGEVVKAVVVRNEGASLDAEQVAAYVERELGSYKKPRIVQFLDELPMTPTGKVNRKLLSEPSP
jgi:acyl-CoA synthetase (AMP-forming)/AMP-acid ligase II